MKLYIIKNTFFLQKCRKMYHIMMLLNNRLNISVFIDNWIRRNEAMIRVIDVFRRLISTAWQEAIGSGDWTLGNNRRRDGRDDTRGSWARRCRAKTNTLARHAHLDALLESTVLTPVAIEQQYDTLAVLHALVGHLFLNRAAEEAFAAFARCHTVMVAGRSITADLA